MKDETQSPLQPAQAYGPKSGLPPILVGASVKLAIRKLGFPYQTLLAALKTACAQKVNFKNYALPRENEAESMKQKFPFETESSSMSLSVRLFWCVAFFGPAAYFGYQGEYLLAVILACAGIGAFSGFRVGMLSILTSVAAITAAIIYAPEIGMQYEQQVGETLGTTGLLNRCVSVAGVGIGISMLVWLVTYLTVGRIVRNRPGLVRMNRRGGFLIGYAQGAAAIVLLVGGFLVMEPIQRQRLAEANVAVEDYSMVHKAIFWTVDQTDASVIGPTIRKYNPIEKIPQLNQIQRVQRTAAVLADPAKMNDVIGHPSILQLQQRPEVQQAVADLRSDESINKILTSGKPMDRAAAMTLLNHPAVLNLVDQPGFLEEATKAIEEAGL